ncbi:hypothetical protein [Actinomycetospora sp. TBRC 11914]|uniref:hypothetical protein n=1 Tax=Actinomycetospora sp. TBRC 11914 TaxID=2729387 RepID=UPI00145CDDC1|nr:hypothetical protein [Actinomycetospora sp. TBRC 11914]NMO93542.1 hypothetical protein [Actinomycetospora sp. TBRC 11914]
MTAFFVPGVGPDRAESRYAELAAIAGAEPSGPEDRVRSIRFVHGAEEWTATVGEPLSGQMTRTARHPVRRASAPSRTVSDPASVQAIFAVGDSWAVVTDAGPAGEVRDSTWDNPVTVSHRDTRQVVRFDA